jgi:cytochrome c oxidase subunit 2
MSLHHRPLDLATPPLTDQATELDRVWTLFLWIGIAVLALVVVLTAWVVVRYRRRDPDELPRQRHYNIPIEVTYTVVPLALIGVLFAVTVVSIDRTHADSEPDLTVDVTAYQWQWQFDYPASGARSTAHDEQNPELVLPADSTVRFVLTSRDVIHSFWVPGFRYKRDVFPDETTEFQVDVGDRLGTYTDIGSCAEFCGYDHARMRFTVRIVSSDEFDRWAADHAREATT